jgi:hypothetical protein
MARRVKHAPRTKNAFPPIGYVRVGGERVAYPNGVVAFGIQPTVGVVGNVQRWQLAARFEREWLAVVVKLEVWDVDRDWVIHN